ncbi:Protein TIFY 4B [Apostasia shenzhenica]|uniref:Protein TIFY n=1 Tax=Apostasia shenzhenica TaxID=1088818 RepID=A0A2I0ARW6_9ASPA|nr:Protein TIFY 4B [Apostasia shenzhenica]
MAGISQDREDTAAGEVNKAGTSRARSLLEKPLSDLTEDDIAQITREECRRFLKERGMRRPSWNKSQAVQQVISLKALIENHQESEVAGSTAWIRRKTWSPRPPRSPISPPTSLASGDLRSAQISKDSSPYRRRDAIPPPSAHKNEWTSQLATVGRKLNPPESQHNSPRAIPNVPAGQLTVFYDGKVNVYDDVPPEKAGVIIQLAASPNSSDLLDHRRFGTTAAYTGPGGPGRSAAVGVSANPPAGSAGKSQRCSSDNLEERDSRNSVPETPAHRKASVTRYLEKRKDRYKGKQIIKGSSYSSTKFTYLCQKFRGQVQNEESNRSIMCSTAPLSTPFFVGERRKEAGVLVDHNNHSAQYHPVSFMPYRT